MNESNTPHPKNVAGPFYVEDGCCLSCDVPMIEAPGLFAYAHDGHCYVKRQPLTPDEVSAMIKTASCSETECIRYRGDDQDVLQRFAELDLRHLCDVPPPPDVKPVIRNHVTFLVVQPRQLPTAGEIALSLHDYLVSPGGAALNSKFRKWTVSSATASFEFAWFEDQYREIRIARLAHDDAGWLVWHPARGAFGERGVSNLIHGWLTSRRADFKDVRWQTEAESTGGDRFWRTPW